MRTNPTAEKLQNLHNACDQTQERNQRQQVEAMQQDPKKLFAKTIEEQGPALIARMQERSTYYKTVMDGQNGQPGIRSILGQGKLSNGPESYGDTLEQIMDAITDVPAYDEEERSQHRYLLPYQTQTKDEDPRTVTYFGANFRQMDQDTATLEQLKQIYPQHTNEFKTLQDGIAELARAHPGNTAYRMLTDNKSYTGEALKSFSKTIGCSALALAGILFGVVGVINKKFDWKALIALGGAAVIASPGLRRSIMGGQLEQELAKTQLVLHKGTIDTMATYDVQGAHWKDIATKIMEKDDSITDAMKALENQPQGLPEEELETLVSSIVGTKETSDQNLLAVRTNLRTMIQKGAFQGFVRSLQNATQEQTQEIVLDFIAAGSAKTAKQIQEIEKLAAQKPTPTPTTSRPLAS